jgi:tetratricopeptide (TPR) repeat protein
MTHGSRLTATISVTCGLVLVFQLLPGSTRMQVAAQRNQIRDPLGLLGEYRGLVEAYQRGGVDGIQDELKKWDAARINDAISLLSKANRSSPLILDTTASRADLGGWSMPLIGAAALLHTDLFLARVKKTRTRDNLHLDFAVQLLALYTGRATRVPSKLRLTLVLTWIRQIVGDTERLRAQLSSAEHEFPGEPALALAAGCLEEAGASPRYAHRAVSRAALKRAEAHYRRALTLDPGFAEARMRLGYVLFRLGRADEATRELQRAVEDARDPYVSYLGTLFLGAVRAHAGRLTEAIETYRKAREIGPACQVSAVALSHALFLTGDRSAAAAAAREASMTPGDCEDPWWSYDYGQARQIDETVEALRREIRP